MWHIYIYIYTEKHRKMGRRKGREGKGIKLSMEWWDMEGGKEGVMLGSNREKES